VRLIALDCEFNQPSGKLIQVGAVCFQPEGYIVEHYMQYVNPGEPLNPEITKLTRITEQDMTDNKHVTAAVAATSLTDFKTRLKINAIPIVWGAGKSNDVRRIYEEGDVESPFTGRIIDVKGAFQMLANACNSEMRQKIGLQRALNTVGLGWDYLHGEPHDAHADAFNTYRMYMFLSTCLKVSYQAQKTLDSLWSSDTIRRT
jgi:DNA polymerase III alpha subunit (gram-positive type)